MGLGKTVQVLALLAGKRGRARSLVVVPRSLVFNWKQEAARFTPKLRVLDHTGTGRDQTGADVRRLRPRPDHLRHAPQRRARRSRTSGSTPASSTRRRRSRTPTTEAAKAVRLVQRRPPAGAQRHAGREPPGRAVVAVRVPQPRHARRGPACSAAPAGIRQPGRRDARDPARKALRPFILRRTKEQVAKDLPEKTEQTLYCDLEPAQRKLYDELRDHYRRSLLAQVDARRAEAVEDPGARGAACGCGRPRATRA